MLRAAVAVGRQKLRGGWRWAVILQGDPWQSWKHRKPRVSQCSPCTQSDGSHFLGTSSGLQELLYMGLQHTLAPLKNWFHLWMLSLKQPPDDLSTLAGSQRPSGRREGKFAALWRDLCSSQGAGGPTDLYRRMVCSAWLKVLAGSALEPQNIVYTAEMQFSCGWREVRAGLLETTWHTPVLCQTRNTERGGVFNYHFLFLFFFLKLIFSHWVVSSLTVPEWITQPYMSIFIPKGLWKANLTNVPCKEKIIIDAF